MLRTISNSNASQFQRFSTIPTLPNASQQFQRFSLSKRFPTTIPRLPISKLSTTSTQSKIINIETTIETSEFTIETNEIIIETPKLSHPAVDHKLRNRT